MQVDRVEASFRQRRRSLLDRCHALAPCARRIVGIEPTDVGDRLPEQVVGVLRIGVGVDDRSPARRRRRSHAPVRRPSVHDSAGLRQVGEEVGAAAVGGDALEGARRLGPTQRDPGCMLGREVQQPVAHPRRDVVERRGIAVQQPLALDPLIPVEDVDVAGSALVRRSGDLARQLLLAGVARDADELARAGRSRRSRRSGRRASSSSPRSRAQRETASDNERVRLNRFLARGGIASRRAADELIKAGRVSVNGKRGELNTFVGSRDVVEVDGRAGRQAGAGPRAAPQAAGGRHDGVRSRGPTNGRRPRRPRSRVVPVGRLDIDTSGVLLLTNDGDLAHRLAHPRYGVEKTYVADVEGDLTPAAVRSSRPESSSRTASPRPRGRVASVGREWNWSSTRAATVRFGACAKPSATPSCVCDAPATPASTPERPRGGCMAAVEPRGGRLAAAAGRVVDRPRRRVRVTRTRRASRARRRTRRVPCPRRATALPSPVICHTAIAVSASAPRKTGSMTKVSCSVNAQRDEHEHREEEARDLRHRVLDDRDREVVLAPSRQLDRDHVLDRVPRDGDDHEPGERLRDAELLDGGVDRVDEPLRDERSRDAGHREQHDATVNGRTACAARSSAGSERRSERRYPKSHAP